MEEILDIQTNLEDIRDLLNKSINKLFDAVGDVRQKDMPPHYQKWIDRMAEAKALITGILDDNEFEAICDSEQAYQDELFDKADGQSY